MESSHEDEDLTRLSGQMNESAHVGFTQLRRFAAENSGAVKIHWPILCNPACTAGTPITQRTKRW
jgi:hypothetical protein